MNTKTARNGTKRKQRTPPADWEALWQTMVRDHDKLQTEIEQLRGENKMLRQNLYLLMNEEYGKPINKAKLLAEALPSSIDEIIAELEQAGR